ncbi:hypothetical protein [Dyadobacter fermentans]|uniref:hypothetical protein n=1 Tax=Dyadobacter fermentans TaxID=94254 RepID=UPI001CBB7A56|nr:hypothetical protein [Dyadobacter fermentans]MBZ1362019.1 hypothetical protein [Dyadobacter fermentans]
MEQPELTKEQMILFRISRLERVLGYIFEHNKELDVPNEIEMGKINIESIKDAKLGKIATY